MADPKPLLFVCPECGAYGPPQAFAQDEDNKAFAALLGEIGHAQLAREVSRYLGLFRPAKRRLTAPRARRLLAELVPMLIEQRVRFDGRDVAAPHDAWLAAITEMLDGRERLQLPMESHNYLLRIVLRRAPAVAAAAEAQAEDAKRNQSQQRRAGFQESHDEFIARRRVESGTFTDHDQELVRAADARRLAAAALQRRDTG